MPRTITFRTSHIRKGLIAIIALAVIAFGAVGVNAALETNEPNIIQVIVSSDSLELTEPVISTLSGNDSVIPEPIGLEQNLILPSNILILGLDKAAWTDAYNAGNGLKRSGTQFMNAVDALRDNSIAGVPLEIDQQDGLRDQGLEGMVKAVDFYQDLLGILSLNHASLDTWEILNPVNRTCYTTYVGVDCPPLPTPTP